MSACDCVRTGTCIKWFVTRWEMHLMISVATFVDSFTGRSPSLRCFEWDVRWKILESNTIKNWILALKKGTPGRLRFKWWVLFYLKAELGNVPLGPAAILPCWKRNNKKSTWYQTVLYNCLTQICRVQGRVTFFICPHTFSPTPFPLKQNYKAWRPKSILKKCDRFNCTICHQQSPMAVR